MKDSNLRLRLVVRRHGLPEVRVVFNIPLENNPTIANLLEQVNDIIPLESNDWGLEDYAVELRDAEGHGFDCLHFQQVSVVLKNDEEIFIRPLIAEDRKKRRLSGRDQISLGGRHLIDGVPFGRPRLRAPADRPPIDIPPLKRRRIAYDNEEADHDSDDDDDPQLLLTQYGEDDDEEDDDYEDPNSVRVSAAFDNLDDPGFEADDDEEEEEDDDFAEDAGDDADEDLEIDGAEIDDELRDLQMENAELEDEPFGPEEKQSLEEDAHDSDQSDSGAATNKAALDLLALDKITALRAAFPTASVVDCEHALLGSSKNEKRAYKKLRETHKPQMSTRAMCRHGRSLRSGGSNQTDDAKASGSDAESVSSLIKHYDEHGFPSGSILAGTASTHMVEALRKSGQPVNLPVHIRFDEDAEEEPVETAKPTAALPDDIASSSDSSRASSPSGHELGLVANKKPSWTSNRDELADDSSSGDDFQPDSDSEESSTSSSDSSDSDNDSDSDSGPEEASSKSVQEPRGGAKVSSDNSNDESDVSMKDDDSSDSSDDSSSDESSSSSDSDSDQDAGNAGGETGSSHRGQDSSDDESSSEESDNEPTPKPQSKSEKGSKTASGKPHTVARASPDDFGDALGTQKHTFLGIGAQSLPGQGTTATQRRNARRRASQKAKREANTVGVDFQLPAVQPHEASTASDTFAAKKAALLKSLGFSEQPTSPNSMDADGKPPHTSNTTELSASVAVVPSENVASTASTPKQTSASSQQRSCLDVGAGRRILFGALGVKAPRNKADEDELRAKLMKDVRVLPNARLESSGDGQVSGNPQNSAPEEEDPEAWREKIHYRAVECCQEGIELSEPPFPFVQRWDPQQQNFWQSKGGKRKQRNQQDFYEEDDQPSAKKRYVGYTYDEGFEGESYLSAADETGNADITLNYDDEPEELHKSPESSQDTEEEDLPPLPSDLSSLPLLLPGEAMPGMVITWKQWLLSKATNWQPQVSSMVALVVSVDHDVKSLRVRLAKRDRNLDQNEKIYDDEGNRIYDKFELPGMDDDAEDGAELGFRTLDEADMIEPQILRQPEQDASGPPVAEQQPSPIDQVAAPCAVNRVDSTSTTTDQSRTIDHEISQPKGQESQPDQMEVEVSQPEVQNSQPVQVEVEVSQPKEHEGQPDRMEVDTQHTGETVIPDTILESATETQVVQPLIEEDVSITEDRRHEISVLMKEAGFRSDIDLPVAEGGPLDQSSPSRQLEEMSQDTELPTSKAPSPLPPNSPQAIRAAQAVSQDPSASSLFVESQPIILEPFSGFSDDIELVVEGQVHYPELAPLHSDAPSAQSGKHPRSDISIELGGELHESLETDPHEVDKESEAPLSEGEEHGDEDKDMMSEDSDDNEFDDEELDDEDLDSDDPDACMDDPAACLDEDYDTHSESETSANAPLPKRSEAAAAAVPALENPGSSFGSAAVERIKARKLEATSDLDSEDALSDFDSNRIRVKKEYVDHNNEGKLSSFAQKLANKPIEKPQVKKGASPAKPAKTGQSLLEPPPPRPRIARRESATPSSSFRIPKGPQVISLVTSSPSPEVVEDYADDSIDETYQDPGLPSGPGWANKKWQSRRGASMPTAAAAFDSVPRRTTAHRQILGGRASAAPTRMKKTSARF